MQPSDRLMRHVVACNNARLPGRRVPFHVDGQPVGWVLPDVMRLVNNTMGTQSLYVGAQHLERVTRIMVEAGLCRWRGEAFDVRATPDGPVLAQVDRGALPSLGIEAVGVHLNGLVERADGLHLWVGRRAMDKKLDPGKLDHIVGGGVPAGLGPDETLVKEAGEEAGLPAELVAQAVHRGVISYTMERPEGLRRDRLHCYDLVLPETFIPVPVDGEVAGFELWPITRVLEAVRDTDDFKFNVNLVLIDLFLRLGLVKDAALEAALHQPLRNPSPPGPVPPFIPGVRLTPPAGKLCQSFQNKTNRPLFITLELSTSRYRLLPGEELVLFYKPTAIQDNLGASLRIEYIYNWPNIELVIWTGEVDVHLPDGRVAECNFDME